MHTYECHGFIWPDSHSQTFSIHNSCCTNCWEQDHTHSADPWQGHAHRSHPAAPVLAVSDGMDNLDVAFNRDDNEAKPAGRNTECSHCYAFKEHADCAVDDRVTVVAISMRYQHDNRGQSKYGGK